MVQLGLPDVEYPTPILNDNQGAIYWIDLGCKPTKKIRHENLAELRIYEAKQYDEVTFYWIPGKTNPADIFTKEDNDKQHYCQLRDLMVMSREKFKAPDEHRWGVLKYRSDDSLMPSIPIDEAEIDLTQHTKIQPLTSFTKTEGQYPAVEITAE